MNSRAYVARFNFSGTDQQKKVGMLSGGERNRVHLAKMLKEGANVLLLDEPTNDLDVNTLRALEEALENFAGCAVVISHDRWFLDRIATHILAFEGDSKVVWFDGNYSEYEADRKAAARRSRRTAASDQVSPADTRVKARSHFGSVRKQFFGAKDIAMNIPRCSLSSWKNLYDAADTFREIACWDWMSDADLFGVQNPNSGEIGYCCVLGELGEVFGLVVYLGSAGLEQQRKIRSGKIHAGLSDAVYSQNCLTAWFGGRSELDRNDLKVVKDLGRKFRGGDAWPQFRSMQPGYIPWFLTEDEVRFLTLCLTQARQVALRFGKDANYLTAPGKNVCLVQVPKQKTDSRSVAQPSGSSVAPGQQTLFPEAVENLEFEWDSQWLAPAPLVKTTVRPVPLDELRLQRIKKTSQGHRGIWEIDLLFHALSGRQRRPAVSSFYAALR